jgi:hypothetical protein
MINEPRSSGGPTTSRLVLVVALAVCAIVALLDTILFQAPDLLGKDRVFTDFNAFHIAGTMALEGRAADAYDADAMFTVQKAVTGTSSLMPWTYPPPYTLAMMALASLPLGIAYLLFLSATLSFFLLIVRQIAGIYLTGVVIAIAPVIFVIVRTGQNGFLTAGLIGWCLFAYVNRRSSGGIPLGLMIIKPHLGAGIAMLVLLNRDWRAITLAAAVVMAALAGSTLAFGLNIWPAFRGGVREAGEFLAAGSYPLFRMTSIYAFVRSLGVDPALAFGVHAAGAVAAIAVFTVVWCRSECPRIVAAAACCMSLFISPYSYDYDLTILGLAIAFVFPIIIEKARALELRFMLALCWVSTGYGLSRYLNLDGTSMGLDTQADRDQYLSLALLPLLLLLLTAWRILRRPDLRVPAQRSA